MHLGEKNLHRMEPYQHESRNQKCVALSNSGGELRTGASHFWSCVQSGHLPGCLYFGASLSATHQAGLWCDALRDGEDTWNKLMTSDPPETKSALHSQTSGGELRTECIALLVLC